MTETASIEQAVLEKLRLLSPEKQQEVLKFVESLWQESVQTCWNRNPFKLLLLSPSKSAIG